MQKTTRTVVLILILICAMLLFCGRASTVAAPSEFNWIPSVQFSASYLGLEVDHMPLRIRDVPIHPDDGGTPGPITQNHYDLPATLALGIGFAGKHGDKWLRPALGLRVNWQFSIANSTARRNYTNRPGSSQRGDGAALTVLYLEARGAVPGFALAGDIFLNLTPEAFFEVHPFSRDNFSLGVSVSYWRAEAVTGWDRFDTIETDEYFTLSHHVPVTLYAKWQATDDEDFQPYFTIGACIQPAIKTSLGREAKLSIPPVGALVAVGVRY